MKAMKQCITKFSPVALFRSLCTAGSATVATSLPAFVGAINTSAMEPAITDDQGDMEAIGGYVVGVLVIPAVVDLIYNILHKA